MHSMILDTDPRSPPSDMAPFDAGLTWRNSFAALGDDFFTHLPAQPLPQPYWVGCSLQVGHLLGLPANWRDAQAWLEVLSGNRSLAGTQSLASVYSGHQFGQWAGQLGDGRALLLGETAGAMELQLKGAGPTPYSRMGDGRAVLRSSIREFLASEAMHGLGMATSRALSVVGSDAPIRRETIETAAVVARVAPSFLRFGHFEHFSYAEQLPQLKALADYVIERFYPDCATDDQFSGNAYANLLNRVSERTAHMVAQWQSVGFCHGVMNTDNMSLLGLTIDYGPFQFMDAFVPGHICNHSDHQGRYAYNKQPNVAYWNLFCLGQALLPLIEEQALALAALESYKSEFPTRLEQLMGAKLGLVDAHIQPPGHDRVLVEDLLKLLAQDRVDYTIFWRRLSHGARTGYGDQENPLARVQDLFLDRAAVQAWLQRYTERTQDLPQAQRSDLMLQTNPKFVLRNHLGEQAIRKARHKDFSEVHTLQMLLETPFAEHPGYEAYADFPPDWASSIEISCSS